MISYTIKGRLIKDSEAVSTTTGNSLEKFTIICDTGIKDKPKFFNCNFFGDRASKLHPYLLKGRELLVIGTPTWREYDGKTYESVTVATLDFCGSKNDAQTTPTGGNYQCDGKTFDTREELEAYKEKVFGDSKVTTPEEFTDDDIPW